MTFDQILRATTWECVSGRRLASELLSTHLVAQAQDQEVDGSDPLATRLRGARR